MMTSCMRGRSPRVRERGVTLVIALIFMVALTLLGIGMVKSTTSEERMGANTRDYDLAFAAAEAAIRDAEVRIEGTYLSPRAKVDVPNYPTPGSCGTATTGTASQIGICLVTDPSAPTPMIAPFGSFTLEDTVHSAQLGQFTGTANVQGVATQPRYYMEVMKVVLLGTDQTAYRITAKGYGARATTQVMLQEVFVP